MIVPASWRHGGAWRGSQAPLRWIWNLWGRGGVEALASYSRPALSAFVNHETRRGQVQEVLPALPLLLPPPVVKLPLLWGRLGRSQRSWPPALPPPPSSAPPP